MGEQVVVTGGEPAAPQPVVTEVAPAAAEGVGAVSPAAAEEPYSDGANERIRKLVSERDSFRDKAQSLDGFNDLVERARKEGPESEEYKYLNKILFPPGEAQVEEVVATEPGQLTLKDVERLAAQKAQEAVGDLRTDLQLKEMRDGGKFADSKAELEFIRAANEIQQRASGPGLSAGELYLLANRDKIIEAEVAKRLGGEQDKAAQQQAANAKVGAPAQPSVIGLPTGEVSESHREMIAEYNKRKGDLPDLYPTSG